jgi:hypothetical protein
LECKSKLAFGRNDGLRDEMEGREDPSIEWG